MKRATPAVLLVLALPGLARADTVVVRSSDGRGESKVTGEIVEWLGDELVLQRVAGREERIASDRVVRVEAQWNESQQRAAALQAAGKCEEALLLYRQAAGMENRAWVRRYLLARMVECYAATGNIDVAGDSFAALIESDPQTPEFAVIPLNWRTVQPTAALESRAVKWQQSPRAALRLLAASWLLISPRRADATTTLRQLAQDPDPRVAFLATAQSWRIELVTVNEAKVVQWQTVLDRMPQSLRAGPYYVVGDALGRLKQHRAAALSFMRVPIQYRGQRPLAAEALWAAAQQLQQLGQQDEAKSLYREIVLEFQEAPCATQARQRLEGSNLNEPANGS